MTVKRRRSDIKTIYERLENSFRRSPALHRIVPSFQSRSDFITSFQLHSIINKPSHRIIPTSLHRSEIIPSVRSRLSIP